MTRRLEVCAGDIASVKAAAEGGAARVELCQALAVGGVTPSIGLIREARKVEGIKVHVLIRPREGDFCYSPEEFDTMEADIRAAVEAGADGVVIGCLNPDGSIAAENARLVKAAGGASVTFHRAFDLVRNPEEALEDVIALGCDRILTSGLAPSAIEGAGMLRKLQEQAGDRLIILAGGGVSSRNAAKLVELTGCSEVHGSARHTVGSPMTFRREDVAMGTPGSDEYSRLTTSVDEVKAIVNEINKI